MANIDQIKWLDGGTFKPNKPTNIADLCKCPECKSISTLDGFVS